MRRRVDGRRPSRPNRSAKRERVAELLARAGDPSNGRGLLEAVDAWRRERMAPMASPSGRSATALIAKFDPPDGEEPRSASAAGIRRRAAGEYEFLPIKDAWFSGSMNYIGRARRPDGTPEYEATYEINASLEISVPEFEQLVSHEVVPGHVTTFGRHLQNLYVRGRGVRGDGADDEHARRDASKGSRTTPF